jgi:hypothetical protein
MRAMSMLARLTLAGTLLVSSVAQAQATKAQAELAAAMRGGTHVALADAIEAATPSGKPISARYEYEDGKLQLTVFVEKAGAYSEVFVDHMTGKVTKIDKITGGDDLKDAKVQSKASAKATKTLASAVVAAVAANPGYAAVDATPLLLSKNAVSAEMTLMKDGKFKGASEPLK